MLLRRKPISKRMKRQLQLHSNRFAGLRTLSTQRFIDERAASADVPKLLVCGHGA